MQCDECKFWIQNHCRRFPPTTLADSHCLGPFFGPWIWPEMRPVDWCGEFQLKETTESVLKELEKKLDEEMPTTTTPTDTERLDFFDNNHGWVFWVGLTRPDGSQTTWPVCAGDKVREEIDRAMRTQEHWSKKP